MNEQQLRDRFEEFDAPSPGLEVDALMPGLRRRAARRRIVRTGSGAALAVTLVAAASMLIPGTNPGEGNGPGPAAGGSRCAGTELPAPAGLSGVGATAIDPSGRYVVGNDRSAPMRTDPETGKMSDVQFVKPVLWTDERPEALPMPAASVWAADVNASGTVAAVGSDDHHWRSVIRYTKGVAETMRTPAGSWIIDRDLRIGEDGDILVNARKAESLESDIGEVWLWKAGSAAADRLPLPALSWGAGLTTDGDVAGFTYARPYSEAVLPYVWDEQGEGRALAVPAGQSASVRAVRGDWVLGHLLPSRTVQWWNLRTGATGTWDAGDTAYAINSEGWIISREQLQRAGTTVTLRAPEDEEFMLSGLSDTGVVAGSVLISDGGDASKPGGTLLWRCDG